jgi:TMEM175 potassium channel family protein
VGKNRAEAFSDGVFAVAATFLVFGIKVPDVHSGLGNALLAEWPSYAAYAISFGTILVIWVNHHAIVDAIERFDRRLLFLNGLLLMTVAAIPFPTGLLAQYLQAGHDQTAAAVAYGLTLTAMSIAFSAFNLYAIRFRRVATPFNWVGFSTGLALWPLGTLVSLADVRLALAIYAFVVLFYVALPILREDRAAQEARLRDGRPADFTHERSGAPKAHGGDLRQDSERGLFGATPPEVETDRTVDT